MVCRKNAGYKKYEQCPRCGTNIQMVRGLYTCPKCKCVLVAPDAGVEKIISTYKERSEEIAKILFDNRKYLFALDQKKENGEKLQEYEDELYTTLTRYHDIDCSLQYLIKHSAFESDMRHYLYDFFFVADEAERLLTEGSVEQEKDE